MTSNSICMISDDIGTCLHAVYCRLKIRTYTQSISKLNLLRACLHAVYPPWKAKDNDALHGNEAKRFKRMIAVVQHVRAVPRRNASASRWRLYRFLSRRVNEKKKTRTSQFGMHEKTYLGELWTTQCATRAFFSLVKPRTDASKLLQLTLSRSCALPGRAGLPFLDGPVSDRWTDTV